MSPVSPGLSASSYGFSADDWSAWDPNEHSPGPDNFMLVENFDGSIVSSVPATKAPLTPAVNPMDLSLPSHFEGYRQSPFRPAQPRELASAAAELQRPSLTRSVASAPPMEQYDQSAKRYPSRGLKRKTSSSVSEEDASSAKRVSPSPPPMDRRGSVEGGHPKKTAHNMIEKRYRTNLNDKITQLRDAVPSLRMTQRQGGADDAEGFTDDDFSSLSQVPKLNKATILSKATDYIGQLESRNRNLETENNALRGRMEGLEMLLMGRTGAASVWN